MATESNIGLVEYPPTRDALRYIGLVIDPGLVHRGATHAADAGDRATADALTTIAQFLDRAWKETK